jgi:hypothetical protein
MNNKEFYNAFLGQFVDLVLFPNQEGNKITKRLLENWVVYEAEENTLVISTLQGQFWERIPYKDIECITSYPNKSTISD